MIDDADETYNINLIPGKRIIIAKELETLQKEYLVYLKQKNVSKTPPYEKCRNGIFPFLKFYDFRINIEKILSNKKNIPSYRDNLLRYEKQLNKYGEYEKQVEKYIKSMQELCDFIEEKYNGIEKYLTSIWVENRV